MKGTLWPPLRKLCRLLQYVSIVVFALFALSSCRGRFQPESIAPKCPVLQDLNVDQCPDHPCTPCWRNRTIKFLRDRNVKVIRVGEDMRVIIPGDRLFNPNSANFRSEYLVTLKATAGLLQCYRKVDVKIAGYTDCAGCQHENMVLSERQAQEVAQYLWHHGVDTRFLYTKGYGSAWPIANQYSYFGRARNRRIEITFRDLPKYLPDGARDGR